MSADERPGLRPALLAAGLATLVLVVLPLGALVRARWSPLIRLDDRVELATHADAVEYGWIGTTAKGLTQLGAPLVLQLMAVVLAVLLVRSRRRRTALYLAVCIAGAYLLSTTGKLLVARARPVFSDPLSHARGTSFPSGHATGSAAFYFALAVIALSVLHRPRRGLLLAMAVLMPVGIASTRVVLGVHYVSDVTAGLLIGWGWAAACTAWFTAWRAEEGRPVAPLEEGIEPEPTG